MICKECANEEDGKSWPIPFRKTEGNGHAACKGGTHCMCQHRTGPDLYVKGTK